MNSYTIYLLKYIFCTVAFASLFVYCSGCDQSSQGKSIVMKPYASSSLGTSVLVESKNKIIIIFWSNNGDLGFRHFLEDNHQGIRLNYPSLNGNAATIDLEGLSNRIILCDQNGDVAEYPISDSDYSALLKDIKDQESSVGNYYEYIQEWMKDNLP